MPTRNALGYAGRRGANPNHYKVTPAFLKEHPHVIAVEWVKGNSYSVKSGRGKASFTREELWKRFGDDSLSTEKGLRYAAQFFADKKGMVGTISKLGDIAGIRGTTKGSVFVVK